MSVETVTKFPINYQVVHYTVGRFRIRIPRLGYDREYSGKLLHLVRAINFVTSVRVNPDAKSLIIYFEFSVVDREMALSQVVEAIQQALSVTHEELLSWFGSDKTERSPHPQEMSEELEEVAASLAGETVGGMIGGIVGEVVGGVLLGPVGVIIGEEIGILVGEVIGAECGDEIIDAIEHSGDTSEADLLLELETAAGEKFGASVGEVVGEVLLGSLGATMGEAIGGVVGEVVYGAIHDAIDGVEEPSIATDELP